MESESADPLFKFFLEGAAGAGDEGVAGLLLEPYRGADWERTGRAACVCVCVCVCVCGGVVYCRVSVVMLCVVAYKERRRNKKLIMCSTGN